MKTAIKVENLSKHFGNKQVLEKISFTVNQGDIYGLIGRNGAGKTTIMKILLGLINQSSGSFELATKEDSICNVGSIIETPKFMDTRTVYQNMVYTAKLIGLTDYKTKIDELLTLVGMIQEKNNKVKKLSLGMRQKIAIAIALLGDPEILILDEPINGLDPVAIAEVRNILLNINKTKNTTIFISSHILGEMQKLATRYGFINNGKLVSEITEAEVEEKEIDLETLSLKLMGVEI